MPRKDHTVGIYANTRCQFVGCDHWASKRGWCESHYMQWLRHGETQPLHQRWGTVEQRFWSRVNKDGPTQPHMDTPCWLWTGGKGKSGYGSIMCRGKVDRAHRVSWMINRDDIPDGKQVLHHCDVRRCVRPGHLYLGTNADNVADRVARERHDTTYMRGTNNWLAKLTPEKVRWIRQSNHIPCTERAKLLGVSPSGVRAARDGVTWWYIDDDGPVWSPPTGEADE